MNFLKKGPELKLSEIKVPGFVQDVYYDLKDRHLLPVAVVLLVAIVAVPIAISKSGSGESFPPPGEGGATASAAPPPSGQLIAEAAPGLRDYHERLEHRDPTDPFEREQAETEQAETATPAGGGTEGSTSPEPSTLPTSPDSESGGGEPITPTEPKLTYYSFAIDVRVSAAGEQGGGKATVRRNLPELTMLPSRETPALVYMGATKDAKKAVMTVSSDVQAIYGDAKCALGSDRCELLVMEPGLPVTLVYGGAGRTYKIELLKINLVESDKLNKAPLGEPKKGGKKRPLSAAPSAFSGHPEEALRGRGGHSRLP